MPQTERDVDAHLPLPRASFHVLLALAEGDAHGYAIKQSVEVLTDGTVRLGPGTLYEAIGKLEERGLIAETVRRPAAEEDHAQRRYYRLTTLGRRVLHAEVRRLGVVLDHARSLGFGGRSS
jgi:DNA-binding PadR family transcriptional regulator